MGQRDELVSETLAINFIYQGNSFIWLQQGLPALSCAKMSHWGTFLPSRSLGKRRITDDALDVGYYVTLPCLCTDLLLFLYVCFGGGGGGFGRHDLTSRTHLVISKQAFQKLNHSLLLNGFSDLTAQIHFFFFFFFFFANILPGAPATVRRYYVFHCISCLVFILNLLTGM